LWVAVAVHLPHVALVDEDELLWMFAGSGQQQAVIRLLVGHYPVAQPRQHHASRQRLIRRYSIDAGRGRKVTVSLHGVGTVPPPSIMIPTSGWNGSTPSRHKGSKQASRHNSAEVEPFQPQLGSHRFVHPTFAVCSFCLRRSYVTRYRFAPILCLQAPQYISGMLLLLIFTSLQKAAVAFSATRRLLGGNLTKTLPRSKRTDRITPSGTCLYKELVLEYYHQQLSLNLKQSSIA